MKTSEYIGIVDEIFTRHMLMQDFIKQFYLTKGSDYAILWIVCKRLQILQAGVFKHSYLDVCYCMC